MISIIICSRKPDITDNLKSNITETIGVDYELIVIDNSENKYSIFSAYNEGVRRAKYPYLCFMHEDILYHTLNWGEKVVEHFQDEKVGLIGVAGGHFLPDCPASWWISRCNSVNLWNKQPEICQFAQNRNEATGSIEVLAVDGLWFCIPKRLFDKISFDEKYYKGFHAYDLDISMQVVSENFKVIIVFDLLIEHFSGGNGDALWFEALEKFYNKWKDYLPLTKGILIGEIEMADRQMFVIEQYKLLKECLYLKTEINQMTRAKSFRLGKMLLKPFSVFRRIFK